MPEQSTLEALSDPESDLYQSYAREMEEHGFGTFATRRNAVTFADAWETFNPNGHICKVSANAVGWLVEVCW